MGFWDLYPNLHAYLTILVLMIIIFSGILLMIISIIHPSFLIVSEFLRNIPIPSCILSPAKVWLSQGLRSYFNHRIIYSLPKQDYHFIEKQYIKCFSPHGVITFGGGALIHDPEEADAFGLNKNSLVVAHQMFHIPFLSHLVKDIMGGVPADMKSMLSELRKNKSLILCPGGAREACAASHRKEILLIRKRKGIFRLALATGVPLLPIYTFGLTQIYKRSGVSVTIPAFFGNLEETIAFQWGRYWSPIPIRKNLLTVVGDPIHVKVNTPTDEHISKLRSKYIKSVKNLFDTWKCTFSEEWKDKKLFIL